ncbi:MAG: hypothetical protein WD572_12345 [Gammaproteobacteria bacterium]
MLYKKAGLLCLCCALTVGMLPVAAEVPAHCDAQARELASQAGQEIFTGMAADQRAALQRLAIDICAKHSANVAGSSDDAVNADTTGSGDWFSHHVLHGKPADKPGNKRLERLGR